MKLFSSLKSLATIGAFLALGVYAASSSNRSDHTDQVQFDSHSLLVKGQRVFLYGGEFHTFRLPVPDLWIDILEKIKAAGFNGVSMYTHMGILNPSRGVVDFDDWRDLKPFFDAASEVGIWVTLRPGPYINAETTAGGIAHWITSEVAGTLRTNASDFRDAWTPYIKSMASQILGNEITDGGPLILLQIDNEYNLDTGATYMAQLEATYREAGIVVPLTYNDAGNQDHFINGTGAVDIHGNDYYPQRFDCSDPNNNWHTVVDYWDYHMQTDPSQFFFVPEFQGGSLQAWGPGTPQYTDCTILTGPAFENVFYRQLWASNAKGANYYMFYGGTSWGAIPYPGVYTSYDYGGTISEPRSLTPKHLEIKLQGIFLRSSPEFYKTDRIGNTSIGGLPEGTGVSDPSAVAVTFLQNPDSGAGFWIARQNDSTSTAITTFRLNVTSSSGELLPLPLVTDAITLSGRESKLIVTDYAYGVNSRMLYSTAQVFFAGEIDGRDVLFLYGNASQSHEFALSLSEFTSSSSDDFTTTPGSSVGLSDSNIIVFSISAPFTPGLMKVFESTSKLILFSDIDTASSFFAPTISSDTSTDPHKNFWGIGTNETVLIGEGPYLVRSASIPSGSNTLQIRGDLNITSGSEHGDTKITIVAPSHITSATWNGQPITNLTAASANNTSHSIVLKGTIPALPEVTVQVPRLSELEWKFHDSLPEISVGFDDSNWTVANHTTTNIPFPMYYGDGRVTYGCDYQFCENIVLWRGHFNATGEEKSVNLSINGGEAFAASVWLNGVFLNTSFGNSSDSNNILEETDDKFIFPEGVVVPGKDNVITIVQDNMGLNETVFTLNDPKSPRGVRGFQLDSGNFSEWKVQGKIGGYTGYPDKVRGVLNEGGLFGERKGWHLPGFNTSTWTTRALSDGPSPDSSAGVGFFVTTFNLSVPSGIDVQMSFTFEEEFGQPYRAYLFVNGWMMGKRVGNLGPQFKFPVHEGILDYRGLNTVAVALWSMENVTISPLLELTVDGVFSGGIQNITTNNPGWSPEGRT